MNAGSSNVTVYRSGKSGSNSKWRAEFTHPVTKERVRGPRLFPTKAAGAEWERDEKAKIQSSGGEYRGSGQMTLGQFVDKTWAPQRNVARSTQARDLALMPRLRPLFERRLGDLRRSDVAAWVKQLEAAGESGHIVRESLYLLSGMFKLAVADGLRATNPAEGVKFTAPAPHQDRILTDDEVDLIIHSMPTTGARVFTQVLAFTGLRCGEAMALQVEYLDLYEKVIYVRWTLEKRTQELKKLKGSDDAYRTVPIPTWLVAELRRWSSERPDATSPFVFQGRQGAHLRYDNWNNRVWKRAIEHARIATPLPTIHDLRHYYGTRLGAAGVGESNIAALMGHSPTSRITRRYVQPTQSRLDQARQIMEE
jgi:integrase